MGCKRTLLLCLSVFVGCLPLVLALHVIYTLLHSYHSIISAHMHACMHTRTHTTHSAGTDVIASGDFTAKPDEWHTLATTVIVSVHRQTGH